MKGIYATENGECIAYTMGGIKDGFKPSEALLTGIRTYPKFRGKGYAKRILAEICAEADRKGVTLMLSAQAEPWDNRQHPGLTQEQLVLWYGRYGFELMFDNGDPAMRRFPRDPGRTDSADS